LFADWDSGVVAKEWAYLFPGLTLCHNCPRRHWVNHGCQRLPGDLFKVRISAVQVVPHQLVLRDMPLRLASISPTNEQEIRYYEYTRRHDYVMFDAKKQCIRDLEFQPVSNYDEIWLYNPDMCNSYRNRSTLWQKKSCERIDATTPEKT